MFVQSFKWIIGAFVILVFSHLLPVHAQSATISLDPTVNLAPVNPFVWGIGSPEKHIWWAGNTNLANLIKNAKIKLIRTGPVQNIWYAKGQHVCTTATSCDFTLMDQILTSIFDSGAEPLFSIIAY